jgi:hypothetical protein
VTFVPGAPNIAHRNRASGKNLFAGGRLQEFGASSSATTSDHDLHTPLTMLPLPTRFSQVFLDTFSLQGGPQTARFTPLLHIRLLFLTGRIPSAFISGYKNTDSRLKSIFIIDVDEKVNLCAERIS